MKGFIVDTNHIIIDGKSFVQLFGRLENGESFVVQNEFKPYFYVKSADLNSIKKLSGKLNVLEEGMTNFSEEPVSKLEFDNQDDLVKFYRELREDFPEIKSYEFDLKPQNRFLIDSDLKTGIKIEGDYVSSERVNRVYYNAKVSSVSYFPKLKVISLDIETSGDGKDLFCVSMYSENYKKTFMITKNKIGGIISCSDEEDCLTKFKEELNDFDPDIITGWNLVDFDLNFLKERFKKNKILFDIARTNDEIRLKIEKNFLRTSRAIAIGRQVIDGLAFIRDPFIQGAPSIKSAKFESYTLESVAQEILGKGKIISGKNRHKDIENWYYSDSVQNLKRLAEYNLLDCKLVYDILEKTKMIELAVERSQLTGMTIDRITSSIGAFDSVYIRKLKKLKIVSPSFHFGRKDEKLKGGYVALPNSGVFSNVLVLDFKSLYPSIIKTFNVDPVSYLGKNKKNEKKVVESPNKVYFKNIEGVLPQIIGELHSARELAKKEKRELSSYAIKIIMNSFWGVLASPNCRYFDFDMASAITSFAREIIQLTAKKIEEKGYKVIYSDTDSVFVDPKVPNYEKANKIGMEIQNYVNNFYTEYVLKNYKRVSYLDLEFQKQYVSMMFPPLRLKEKDSDKSAAKKRYAGLLVKDGKEELEVVGLEAIRGDWTVAAQEFQVNLLMKVFKQEEIESEIKNYVKKISSGELDEKLLYRKSIRKDLEDYKKTTPPHVKAARKLDKLESSIIEYYITIDGPEPLQNLKHKIDYEHYIDKQIKPIANQILNLFDKDFDDLLKGSTQQTLF